MKIEQFEDIFGTKYVYKPNWNENYCFRAWPRKIADECMDKLPDPNVEKSPYYIIPIYEEIEPDWYSEETMQNRVTIKGVIFKRIQLGYQRGDTIVYCYDWEQVK